MKVSYTHVKKGLFFLILGQAGLIASAIIACFTNINTNVASVGDTILTVSSIVGIVAAICNVLGYAIASRDKVGHFGFSFILSIIYIALYIVSVILVSNGTLKDFGANLIYCITHLLNVLIILDVILGCCVVAPESAGFFMASFYVMIFVFLFSLFFRWFFPVLVTREEGKIVLFDTFFYVSSIIYALAQVWYLVLLIKTRKHVI